jgi:hypothetical protein
MSDIAELQAVAARLRDSDPAAAEQIERVLARMAEWIQKDPLAWRSWNREALRIARGEDKAT